MENLEEHTIGVYIKNNKAKGLKGLNISHGGGAQRKINSDQEKLIVEIITTKTTDYMCFEYKNNWTIELVRQMLIKD